MNSTLDTLKELRDKTGVSVMQCKKALEEAGNDIEKALVILTKFSSQAAEKRSGRDASDGSVVAKIENNKIAMVALKCETDFVAKSEDFVGLSEKILNDVLANGKEGVEERNQDAINAVIQKTGENVVLGEIKIEDLSVGNYYIHGGKYGVIVNLEGGTPELAKDIALHYAAMRPRFVDTSEIKDEDKKIVIETFTDEIAKSDKPQEIKDKMLAGKIDTYFKELTLKEQMFVKDSSKTIKQILAEAKAEIKSVSVVTLA